MMAFLRFVLLFVLIGAVHSVAWGQYAIELKLDRNTYLAQELITATVTVTNRSGADAVIGGKEGERWLTFDVTNPAGNKVPALVPRPEKPLVFPAGQTVSRKFYLTETHSFSDEGLYRVVATVYHGASGQYFESNRCLFTITNVQPFMPALSYGVPVGFPEAGRARDYVTMIYQEEGKSYFYVRLVDKPTGAILITHRLGSVSLQRDPQLTLDKDNQLHAMFMTARDIYAYFVVTPDGKLKSRQLLKETAETRPKLYLAADNAVILRGGVIYDPAAEKAKAAAQKPRSMNQRPPGL
jgi:hypothetical protein